MVYIWIASSFNLYLLTYSVKNIPGDYFMNQLISSTADIGLVVLGGFAYGKLGLRPVLILFFVISLIGGFLIMFLGE
jgi:hypothetical protein